MVASILGFASNDCSTKEKPEGLRKLGGRFDDSEHASREGRVTGNLSAGSERRVIGMCGRAGSL